MAVTRAPAGEISTGAGAALKPVTWTDALGRFPGSVKLGGPAAAACACGGAFGLSWSATHAGTGGSPGQDPTLTSTSRVLK